MEPRPLWWMTQATTGSHSCSDEGRPSPQPATSGLAVAPARCPSGGLNWLEGAGTPWLTQVAGRH